MQPELVLNIPTKQKPFFTLVNTAQPATGVYISHRTLQEHPIAGIFWHWQ